jgi:hypothetical protein
MLPLSNFSIMLRTYRDQMHEDYSELIAAADLIGGRPNYLTVDEHGYYHLQASGNIDEVIKAITDQLEKLKRIKAQKDRT